MKTPAIQEIQKVMGGLNPWIAEWISNHQLYISIERGKPVMVPEAYDSYVEYRRSRFANSEYGSVKSFIDNPKLKDSSSEAIRLAAILNYFAIQSLEPIILDPNHDLVMRVGKPCTDSKPCDSDFRLLSYEKKLEIIYGKDGFATSLVGDIKRYGGLIASIDPKQVKISPDLIHDYSKKYDILALEEKLLELSKISHPNIFAGVAPDSSRFERDYFI